MKLLTKTLGVFLKQNRMETKRSLYSEFFEKVEMGLKISGRKMLSEKIAKDQSVVIMHKGKMITIKASEVCNLK